MHAILLCGGRGTRLDGDTEKPLHPVAGRPMLDRVRDALRRADRVDTVHLVTAPSAPRTARHAAETATPNETVLDAPGEGYVADLGRALRAPPVDLPALTVVADLPLLAPDAVDAVHDRYAALDRKRGVPPDLTVCVPTALKRALGVSADTTRAHGGRDLAPTGVNVVGSVADPDATDADPDATDADPDTDGPDETDTAAARERLHVTHDARLAVNVNRLADAAVAERLADGGAPR
jgi:adenosylcobinamide-phosphate guanylyltransferase